MNGSGSEVQCAGGVSRGHSALPTGEGACHDRRGVQDTPGSPPVCPILSRAMMAGYG